MSRMTNMPLCGTRCRTGGYDEVFETTLRDIEWSTSRTGQINPVAIFDEIDLDGALTTRASLHNISFIKEKLGVPFYGQKIYVSRRNEVIPHIEYAEKGEV